MPRALRTGTSRSPSGVPNSRRYTFPKTHRLKRQRLIRSLFDRGRADVGTVAVGTVRLLFRVIARDEAAHDVPVKIGFAPGRRVQSGVARNRIRRLLREVYRRHQHELVDLFACPLHAKAAAPQTLACMILFRGDPAHAADALPRDLPDALRRVVRQVRAARSEASE